MSSALQAIGCKLAKAQNLSDTDFYAFLEELDCDRDGTVRRCSRERERTGRIDQAALSAAEASVCSLALLENMRHCGAGPKCPDFECTGCPLALPFLW